MSQHNGTLLLNLIEANATILAAVDAYGVSGKAIFHDNVLPSDFTGAKSINIYQIAPSDMTMGHDEFRYSASCRANTFGESLDLAKTLVSQLNRYLLNTKGIKMSILPTIPPKVETGDNYNTPVEIYFITAQ